MFFMYSLSSLPFIYVFSFAVKRELIGVINFFLLNVLMCFIDMILSFLASVVQGNASPIESGMTSGATAVTAVRWILSVLLPTVNLKHALSNIRLHSNRKCISSLNSIMGTNYAFDESWMSVHEPGLGLQFLIFCVQTLLWWLILMLIENFAAIKQIWQRHRSKTNESDEIQVYDDSVIETNYSLTSFIVELFT